MNFDLQLFGERNLSKIDNPAKYCVDWNSYDAGQREGLIEHWQHEIGNTKLATSRNQFKIALTNLQREENYHE